MSEWTSLAAKVLDHRYDKASYWSSVPENEYRANPIMEARLATVLFPGGAYESPAGSFAFNWNTGTQTERGKDPRILPLIIFRTVPSSLGANNLTVPYDEYQKAKWFREDWSYPDLVPEGMHWTYRQFLDRAKRLWYKILTELPWVPNTIAVKVDRAIQIGMLPRMLTTQVWQSQFGPLPTWLQSPYRQAAWNELVAVLGTLNKDVSSANVQALNTEADSLEASREFWDAIAKYSGADMVASKWAELKRSLRAFNSHTKVSRETLARCDAIIRSNPNLFTDQQKATVAALESETQNNVAGLKSDLPSPILAALGDDGEGIGAVAAVIIGLGVAVIISAAAIVVAYMNAAQDTARLAIKTETELLATMEAEASEAYKMEISTIVQEEQNARNLRDMGQITQADYDQRMAALTERREDANAQLALRRAQSNVLVEDHHRRSKELTDAANEAGAGFLANAKGILMWGVLGIGLVMAGPTIMRRLQ